MEDEGSVAMLRNQRFFKTWHQIVYMTGEQI